MTIKIQHKRSAVKGKAPLPADLEYGEIAVNYEATDPALYVKDSADAIRKIGEQPTATEIAAGIVELATAAETTTGTDATRAVHPAGLTAALTFTQTGAGAKPRSYDSKLKDVVSVKDFGARGDGLGTTPADEGVDISTATWNTWDGTPFKTDLAWSPYGSGGVFTPPTAKPFQNTDTWDFIGAQLALWNGGGTVYFPEGKYVINVSRIGGGLVIMRGQQKSIIGAGFYRSSITTKESSAYFGANNVGFTNAYWLLRLYRVGGPPTLLADIGLSGPTSYGASSNNLTLVHCENINGVTFRDLWLDTAHRGISALTLCSDNHLKGTTSEYLFGQTVYTDSGSEISIDFCNFWASAVGVTAQKGVIAVGRGSITNSRFIAFTGNPVELGSGLFSNNYLIFVAAGSAILAGSCVVSNNIFSGSSPKSLVTVGANSSVVGNRFEQAGPHPCLNLGADAIGSATNINVTGNTFIKTDNAVQAQNYAITGLVNGSGYFNALTASTLIVGNTFQGRALEAPGTSTMVKNTFDGVLQGMVNAEAVTNNGSVNVLGDVLGKALNTGTTTSGTVISITGMLGQGSGAVRDQTRLNLISVLATGTGFVGRAYGLFTSKFNGNATLISTLGTQSDGGSIAFSTSGTDPTFTPTASGGGSVNYTVTSIPLG